MKFEYTYKQKKGKIVQASFRGSMNSKPEEY